ncbi:MAG TPA: TMEM14 family protein [Chthoniobacteraceae bacterium]|nr:TMEM14 family protein [Chthoniobacteraceae bacterium]
MIEFARIYLAIFGILTIVGGVMGYVKKKSVPSIVAGAVCGVLLIWAAILLHAQPLQQIRTEPLILALVVSVVLAGRFIPNYIEKRALIPGGLMALLSGISIVVTLLAWYKR